MWGLLRRPLRRDELRDLVGEGSEGRRAVELLDLVAERPGLAVSDASVAGGRGRGPGAAARDINVGRILHYGSELLLRGDASAVDESEPRRPLRHRRRPDTARLPLNLYTRCAKCSAGRRVGGNYFTSKRRFLDRGGPAKNPTYGTNRCHLDTNKSWWAPDWLSYHTRENNGSAAFPRWRKISSSWRTICSCETPTGLIGRPRRITRTELELSQDRTLFRERRLSRNGGEHRGCDVLGGVSAAMGTTAWTTSAWGHPAARSTHREGLRGPAAQLRGDRGNPEEGLRGPDRGGAAPRLRADHALERRSE